MQLSTLALSWTLDGDRMYRVHIAETERDDEGLIEIPAANLVAWCKAIIEHDGQVEAMQRNET